MVRLGRNFVKEGGKWGKEELVRGKEGEGGVVSVGRGGVYFEEREEAANKWKKG